MAACEEDVLFMHQQHVRSASYNYTIIY